MRMFSMIGLLFMVLVVPFLGPSSAQAQDTCHCFCGMSNANAYLLSEEKIPQADCTERCEAADDIVVGCFEERSQWPDKSALCWTESQCASQGAGYTWVDDTSRCWDNILPMGYCYAPLKTVTLLQPFGGNTSFSGIADYASAAYEFLVPVMAMVAVVILMVSGLQYILAGGNTDQIKSAKSRMTGAVTGLILLMSAWTIANVLDPRLVNLQQLRVPAQKKVVLLDPDSTCEKLALSGIGISSTASGDIAYGANVEGACGTQGYVRDFSQADQNAIIGNWKEGDRCNYNGCGDGEACSTAGGTARCVACDAAASILGSVSSDVCQSFEAISLDTGDDEMLCTYIADAEDVIGRDIGSICAEVELNCAEWFSDGGGCRDYDEVVVQGGAATGILRGRADAVMSETEFARFCRQDYCNLGGEVGCQVAPDTAGLDCVGVEDSFSITDGEISASMTCYNAAGMVYDCADGEVGTP